MEKTTKGPAKTQPKAITAKERKFVEAYAENGGNGTKAALKAYGTTHPRRAASMASRTLRKPEVKELLERELKKQGITLARSLSPIAKGLVATKVEDGQTVDDLDVQLRASDRALKLLLPKEQLDASLNFNLNIDSAHFGGEFVVDGEAENE